MKKYIKVITGFRQDQYYTIDAEEAHKAYYLFLNPEMRGVFNNGVALIGKNIQGIEPDYNATMGYNPNYKLEGEDWNEISGKGVDRALRDVLSEAKQIATTRSDLISLPMAQAREQTTLLT